jgi:hypothetical protein
MMLNCRRDSDVKEMMESEDGKTTYVKGVGYARGEYDAGLRQLEISTQWVSSAAAGLRRVAKVLIILYWENHQGGRGQQSHAY